MRFFHHTNFPFMKYRFHWIAVSASLVAISLALALFRPGLKYGVDFAGGTQLTVKFKAAPDLARVRGTLERLNLGAVSIQRFDEIERNELLVRLQNTGQEGDFSARMIEALDAEFNQQSSRLRLNLQGMEAVRDELVQADPDRVGGTIDARRAHYQPMAEGVLALRKQIGIFSGPADFDRVAELSAGARRFLGEAGRFGEFAILAADSVGPAVGKDLRTKAAYAVGFSIVGMLIYIWFRFQFQYGVGAVVALIHDTIIALGALAITGRDIDIPTIAALLTLVGYSVNDTVIIFDRIRERIKLNRGRPLVEVMNDAINQTLSRTVITSGLTELVVVSLFLFGGDVINTFAFVLMLGIVVGTYSSVYIASPIALAVTDWREGRRRGGRRR